jgi:cephalosporin hydroxylase
MAEFIENTNPYSNYIKPIRGRSADPNIVDEAARLSGKIHLLFIDGVYPFDGVLSDWKAYQPLLSDNEVIAMGDIGWADGVKRVVAEEIHPPADREAQLKNLWWGWMKN